MRTLVLLLLAAAVPLAAWALLRRDERRELGTEARAGGLRIEAVLRSARNFNANYGFVRTTYVEFQVLHAGKPLRSPGRPGEPALQDFHEAWVLAGASRPAILAGRGSSLFLFTEADGRPQVRLVADGGGPAATVQWLDGHGGPGPVLRVGLLTPTRPEEIPSRSLKGGQRLLLNGKVELDLATLDRAEGAQPSLPDYRVIGGGPVAVSPSGRKRAWFLRATSNVLQDCVVLVQGRGPGEEQILPLDLQEIGADASGQPPAGWFERQFRWNADEQLQVRPPQSVPAWRGRYELGRFAAKGAGGPVPRFRVAPVAPSILPAVQAALVAELGCQAEGPTRVMMAHVPVEFAYLGDSQTLVVTSELPGAPLWAQEGVIRSGELIKAKLASGQWREHLRLRR